MNTSTPHLSQTPSAKNGLDAQEYNPAGAGVDPPKHPVSPCTVRRLLNGLEHCPQGNRKTMEVEQQRFVQHPLPSGGGEMPGAWAGEL